MLLELPWPSTAGVLARRGVTTPPAAADNVEIDGEGEGEGLVGEGGGRGIVARREPGRDVGPDEEEVRLGDGGTDMPNEFFAT